MNSSVPAVRIETNSSPGADWDDYVTRLGRASLYHGSAWIRFIGDVFQQQTYCLEARAASGELVGVLPLVRQFGPLFGSSMTSLPYFNYGGALGDSEKVVLQLMDSARTLAARLKCRYLELRDTVLYAVDWAVRTDKVSMVLDLPHDAEVLGKSLGSKLRSQIRRPDREEPEVVIDGPDGVDGFYDVFCRNMHALGTPVYPKRFFLSLVGSFPQHCHVVVVRQAGVPQAAGFLIFHGDTAEIPWAACREDAKPRGYNMKLYWECLKYAISRGCRQFDLGRSTVDSGTFRFKAQWGARPRQLYWYRCEFRRSVAPTEERADPRRLAAGIWSRLPLRLANMLGPLISPRLPW